VDVCTHRSSILPSPPPSLASLYESGAVIPSAPKAPEGAAAPPGALGATGAGGKTLTSKAAGLVRLFKRGAAPAPSKPPGGDDHPIEATLSGGRRRPSGMGSATIGVDAFAAALASDPSGVRAVDSLRLTVPLPWSLLPPPSPPPASPHPAAPLLAVDRLQCMIGAGMVQGWWCSR
jgi:hypothetical protein